MMGNLGLKRLNDLKALIVNQAEFSRVWANMGTDDKIAFMKELWTCHDSLDRDKLQEFVKTLIADFEAFRDEEMRAEYDAGLM
jgi:hypothetical protein